MGSTTLKYATALTRSVTLSLVMTSWGGMSAVTVWRLTRTIRSTTRMMKNRPGPLAPITRPSRKITPRSYSGTILTAAMTMRISSPSTARIPYSKASLMVRPFVVCRFWTWTRS
jgi:hypothetical protein